MDEFWGDDYIEEEYRFQFQPIDEPVDVFEDDSNDIRILHREGEPNGHDILKFAKCILICIFSMFILVSATNILLHTKETEDLWNFTTPVFNSLISIVIGYYFAKKS